MLLQGQVGQRIDRTVIFGDQQPAALIEVLDAALRGLQRPGHLHRAKIAAQRALQRSAVDASTSIGRRGIAMRFIAQLVKQRTQLAAPDPRIADHLG